jgi:ubiquinone/menaquinone biosynthesis C-methylase UbiE
MAEEFWWKRAGMFYAAARRSEFVKNVHRAFLKRVDELNLPAGTKVLDAGCGDGNISFPLAQRGFEVTGIDFGDSVLRQARKRQKRLGIQNARFEFGDLNYSLRYPDSSFGLITSTHVIMKVKNYACAFSEFYRLLRPGGYLVISTTSSNETFTSWFARYIKKHGLPRSLWDVRWLIAWGVPYCLFTRRSERRDEWRWPPAELERHSVEAGFKTVVTEEVAYTHVGCALGVFRKAAGA